MMLLYKIYINYTKENFKLTFSRMFAKEKQKTIMHNAKNYQPR